MSWTLGDVTFPKPPAKVIKKHAISVQKIPMIVEAPWLLSMGTDVPQLALEGEMFENDNVTETLYNTYMDKLYSYVGQGQVIDEPLIMGDAVGSGVWHKATGAGTFKNTGADQIKFDSSVYLDFNAGGGYIYRTFDSNRDFKKHNIVSIWMKRTSASTANTKAQITFYTDAYPTITNGYRFYPDYTSDWTQTAIAKSGSDGNPNIGEKGSPTGWDKIRWISIEASNNANSDAVLIDAGYIGHGWNLNAPGTRFDGIYVIADLETNEGDGVIHSLPYRINLYNKTGFFGEDK